VTVVRERDADDPDEVYLERDGPGETRV